MLRRRSPAFRSLRPDVKPETALVHIAALYPLVQVHGVLVARIDFLLAPSPTSSSRAPGSPPSSARVPAGSHGQSAPGCPRPACRENAPGAMVSVAPSHSSYTPPNTEKYPSIKRSSPFVPCLKPRRYASHLPVFSHSLSPPCSSFFCAPDLATGI